MRRPLRAFPVCVCLSTLLLLPHAAGLAQSSQPPPEEPDHPHEADDHLLRVYEEVEVIERVDDLVGVATTSSEGSTGKAALEVRPIQRTAEIVETVPGLIATQHSGDGKANQYFLRGFNLDHGTDFSISVAGVPVNMPSHAHGQGYADLNFLIPEAVERVRYSKGLALASVGDFSAAGSSRMDLISSLDEGLLSVSLGSYGYQRAVVGDSFALGEGQFTAILEGHHNDGPWDRPNDFRRFNGLLHYDVGDASRGFSVTAMGYDGSWLSTDQVPRRAVERGA